MVCVEGFASDSNPLYHFSLPTLNCWFWLVKLVHSSLLQQKWWTGMGWLILEGLFLWEVYRSSHQQRACLLIHLCCGTSAQSRVFETIWNSVRKPSSWRQKKWLLHVIRLYALDHCVTFFSKYFTPSSQTFSIIGIHCPLFGQLDLFIQTERDEKLFKDHFFKFVELRDQVPGWSFMYVCVCVWVQIYKTLICLGHCLAVIHLFLLYDVSCAFL